MTMQGRPVGTILNDRYRILRVLGRGGMGIVYLAEHIQLDTAVALKGVRGRNPEDEEYQTALARCRHEGRILVRLDHPNLPKVTDAFVEDDGFYLAMEYIEGVTAEELLREAGKPLAIELVIEWGLQLTAVLGYLHSQEPPIIFRDLKPDNIMVQPDGVIKLIDFGIARHFADGAAKDTVPLGCIGFSPPEQFGRFQTDARSDLYSLGATLHHLLTGYDPALKPFRFPPAIALNPAVPPELSHLIDRCVAIDPALRPTDDLEARLVLLSLANAGARPAGISPDADNDANLFAAAPGDLDLPLSEGTPGRDSFAGSNTGDQRRRAGYKLLAGIAAMILLPALWMGWRHRRAHDSAPVATRTAAMAMAAVPKPVRLHTDFQPAIGAKQPIPVRAQSGPVPWGVGANAGPKLKSGEQVKVDRRFVPYILAETPGNLRPGTATGRSSASPRQQRHTTSAAHKNRRIWRHRARDVYDVDDGSDFEAQLRADMRQDLGFDSVQ